MSALAVNSLLENSLGSLLKQNLATLAAQTTQRTIIDRKHYSGGGGGHYGGQGYHGQPQHGHKKSRSIALTALTLLAFLFFLNILQQCLQEQMEQVAPQVVIMQARIQAAREAEAMKKEAEKRMGESVNVKTTVSPVVDDGDDEDVPIVSREENLYRYEKVHVPVQLKSLQKGRH